MVQKNNPLQAFEPSMRHKRSRRRTRTDYRSLFLEDKYLASCLVELSHSGNDVSDILSSSTTSSTGSNEPKLKNSKPASVAVQSKMITKHKCNVCDKEFLSYQALGGHKTTHRKLPNSGEPSMSSSKSKCEAENVHQCSVCHKNFFTGQALGGHMRCHFEGTIKRNRVNHKNNISSSKGMASNNHVNNRRPFLGFDLNLPALPDNCPGCFVLGDDEVSSLLPDSEPSLALSLKIGQ